MESWSPVKDEVTNLNIEDEQPLKVKSTAKALSDGSRDETPTQKYRHTWTAEHRLTLAILAECYSNKWSEKTYVFNHFHRGDLRRCGGLRQAVLSTQYNDMRAWFDGAENLLRLQATLAPYERSKLASQPGLEKAALDIGIQLILKKATPNSNRITIANQHDRSKCKRKRDRTDFLPDRSDEENQTASCVGNLRNLTVLPKTPTKRNGKREEIALLTPPDSKRRKIPQPTVHKELARVGFRAVTAQTQGKYSSVLGIRAGAFINQETVPIARNLETSTYDKEVLHHIKKYDLSRPSMFVSATKNPIRTIHMLLHAPQGRRDLVLIDLHAADVEGNVQKASNLKLQTDFKYSPAGEYLIFGGVPPEAIIANIPLSRLLDRMPTTPESDDPFCLKVLQQYEKLSDARLAIKDQIVPMTFCLGKAVGKLVGLMGIPPKHYQDGVWALVQDYKFYNAEGGQKKGRWFENVSFKEGALEGYQATRGTLPNTEGEETKKKLRIETVEIADDLESDSDSDEDCGGDVSSFLAELKEVADSESHGQDETANLPPDCQRINSDRDCVQDLNELCSDVNHMHGNTDNDSGLFADEMDMDYEFGWTGM